MSVQTTTFPIVINQFDGWQTSRDSDDIGDSKSPNLSNVRINGSHFRGSKGYSLIGTRVAPTGKVRSQYTYKRNDGVQVMVKLRDDGSNTILDWYDSVNDEFYTLLPGLTTGKKMGFAEFNTSSVNSMIFCNGVENLSTWTGATTRITSTVTGSPSTINVSDTSNFPATGTIIYNGIEIAYTGKTATTFTVASGHDSAGADDGVAQAVDDSTHSGITKGNILLSAKDRLWIAGQPSAPGALDYSDEGDFSTFTGGANRADSGTEDFFNIGGKITGLSEKDEEIIVMGEDGADGFSFSYPTATTKAPIFREIFRSSGNGPLNHESVFKVSNDIYFANRDGIASISDLEGSEKVYKTSITREILPTLKDYKFDEAESVWFESESILLMTCKSVVTSPGNDVVIGLEFYQDTNGNNRLGIVKFDWPVNSFAILENINGTPELYFGSSFEQNSFKAFDTYQNDGSPRTIRYTTKRFNFKDPFQNKECSKVAVRGFIKDGTDITAKLLLDAGFLGEQSKTIESTGSYVSSSTLNAIGSFANGTNPIGSQLSEVSDLKEFTVFLDFGVDFNPKDVQMDFSSDTDAGTFIITHVGFALEKVGVAVEENLLI